MSALKKGLKFSHYPAPSPAPSESGRKRARHAAHSTPWMLCVNTHYPSDPSWAKRPPRSASPTHFEGSLRRPLETTATTRSPAKIRAAH